MKLENKQKAYKILMDKMKIAQGKKSAYCLYFDNEYNDFFILEVEKGQSPLDLRLPEYSNLDLYGYFENYCGRYLCTVKSELRKTFNKWVRSDRESGKLPMYLDEYAGFSFRG